MPERDGKTHEERLQELRERLYSRGVPPPLHGRSDLGRPVTGAAPIADHWQTPAPAAPIQAPMPQEEPRVQYGDSAMKRPHMSYRLKILIGGLIFFVIALALSGSFLLFGKNTISGDNITLTISNPPFAVSGGGELNLQVTVGNQNTVPIESATLIIDYPLGTQSVDESGKELVHERRPLNLINQGEVLNIPLRAKVFGEENEEKTVLISIEYRVKGSNAMFYKEAAPINFKISSSPVVLFVKNVTKVSSGQEVELTIDVSSNAPSEISDILLKAGYPAGFEYEEATPPPVSGRDTWSVENLKPGEKKTITIKGALVGKQDENKVFNFSVGVPNERDKFSLASIFTTQKEEIKIEQPFLDVSVSVNGKQNDDVVITPGSSAQVSVAFKNSVSSTLYDGKITVDLSGTGLDESQVEARGGFYDSTTNTITWDGASTDSLKSIRPGEASTVSFTVTPLQTNAAPRTPQIELTVNVEANRRSEGNVSQKLTGTATQKIKVESSVAFSSSILYSTGAFVNTGPVPPKAEETTTYNVLWYVKNGTNATTDGVVTGTLPQYATWLDKSTTPDVFSYNPTTREIAWKVGDVGSNDEREAEFQISFTPSLSQVGQEVTLVKDQRFKTKDRFTESVLRDEASDLTTSLIADPDHANDDGRVAPKSE